MNKSCNNNEELISLKIEDDSLTHEEPEFLYAVSQRPPLHMIIFLAFQHALLSLAGSLAVSTFVAEAVCAGDDVDIRAQLFSSTLFMNGITTLLMVVLGIRLPLYQGATGYYLVPLLSLKSAHSDWCLHNATASNITNVVNATLADNVGIPVDSTINEEFIYAKIRVISGCLALAGVVHCLIGATGLIGFAMKAIGPVTVVPTLLLLGIYMCKATTKFSKIYWGISLPTAAIAIILSIYMRKVKMPIPTWTRKSGFHIIRYPLHQVYALAAAMASFALSVCMMTAADVQFCVVKFCALCWTIFSISRTVYPHGAFVKILIAMLLGWMMSGILTKTGVLTDDPENLQYKARTDARLDILTNANWFTFPYPGQFGPPSFDGGIFVGFLVATLVSILDSVGDYHACARICNVPPPPEHGINRGIAIEGLCSTLSGAVGCGHATSTIGGNIGAIGVTRAASRDVFLGVAIIYILFGIMGKFSAIFITMPYPVLGGGMIIMYGMFTGVVLSNLEVVSLSSTRNLAIIGLSLLVGLMLPHWIETTPNVAITGHIAADKILRELMANPNITGGVMACFLDNTCPGTKKERGIEAWQHKIAPVDVTTKYSEGPDIYHPLLPKTLLSLKIMKYIPFLPYTERK